MANIIPHLTDEQIKKIPSKAEQKVYKSLQEVIPHDWLVVHSLEFVKTTSKYNSHGNREADFVIFSPLHGVLVVEVKGGGIKYDKTIDQWYSLDRNSTTHKIKNPIRQANEAKYEIGNHLAATSGNEKILLGHAALFPDIENVSSLVNVDMPIDILGSNRNLIDIKGWIISIFNYWSGNQPIFDPLEERGIKAARSIYGKKATILPSLRALIEEEIEKQIELTNQQKSILRQLKRRKEAIIEGGAGTGKTILALDHAQTLANQGLKVLFLCYNQKLGNELKRKSDGVDNLHSMGFHEFCSWRIRQVKSDTGRELMRESRSIFPNEDEYDVIMPDALINSYDISAIEYDVIIIDEGQDFKSEYWLAIELLKESSVNTKLYIFLDSNQAIYTEKHDLPINPEPLFLFDNCRNTKFIHNSAYQYYKGIEVEAPDLAGESVKFITKPTTELQAKEIDKAISRLISIDGISPHDLAVIVMGDFSEAELLLQATTNSHLWAYKEYSPKNKVLVETSKRFKGLEAKIIFLWVMRPETMDESVLYVSISRARFRLWVVGGDYIEDIRNIE